MPLKTHQEQGPELNLTPMIDIVFLLIIFFMVGTKFAELERTVDLDVPRVSELGQLTDRPTKLIVNVFRDGRVLLGQRPVTMPELTAELEQSVELNPNLSVVVRGDSQGAFQGVASVLTVCSTAGVRDLGISVQPDVQTAQASAPPTSPAPLAR